MKIQLYCDDLRSPDSCDSEDPGSRSVLEILIGRQMWRGFLGVGQGFRCHWLVAGLRRWY